MKDETDFNIHELGRKLSALADEIQDLNTRLLSLNGAIFGTRRAPDIPTEPPSDPKPDSPAIEYNLYDAVQVQGTRAFYYMTYAREMVGQLESFSGTSGKQADAGGSLNSLKGHGAGGSGPIPADTFRR